MTAPTIDRTRDEPAAAQGGSNVAQTTVITIPNTDLFFVSGRVDKAGHFISAGLHSVSDVVSVPHGLLAVTDSALLREVRNAAADASDRIAALPIRRSNFSGILKP